MPSITDIKRAPPPTYQIVNATVCVVDRDVKTLSNGSRLLTLSVHDGSPDGDIRVKCFDDNPTFGALADASLDSWYRLKGNVRLYNNTPEINVQKNSPVVNAEAPEGVNSTMWSCSAATVAEISTSEPNKRVSLDAVVVYCDGACDEYREGKRKRQMVVRDSTGDVLVNLWNSDDSVAVKSGDCIHIKRARVGKHRDRQQLEVNWSRDALVPSDNGDLRRWWSDEGGTLPVASLSGGHSKLVKVRDLPELVEKIDPSAKQGVDIVCVLTEREVKVSADTGDRLVLTMADETGSVRLTAFDRKVQSFDKFKVGDTLIIRNADLSSYMGSSLVANASTQVSSGTNFKPADEVAAWYKSQDTLPDMVSQRVLKSLSEHNLGDSPCRVSAMVLVKRRDGAFTASDETRADVPLSFSFDGADGLVDKTLVIKGAPFKDGGIHVYEDNIGDEESLGADFVQKKKATLGALKPDSTPA